MNEKEKLEIIAESVEMETEELSKEMVLEDLENWDSVAVLTIIAAIRDRLGRYPSAQDILAFTTVGDLMNYMD